MHFASSNFIGAGNAPAFLNPPGESIAKTSLDALPAADVSVLTARMSQGDELAFHEFYRLYFNRLLRYLIVVTNGQEEITREALQITFVRVARHVRRFDSETAFWNWLAMLARNCVVDEIRKRSRFQRLLTRFFRNRPAEPDSRDYEAEERLMKLLEEEVAGLPVDERVLLERKYVHGESVQGLANEWSMDEKAMESRLLRIRRKLKAAIINRLKNEKAN